MSAMTITEKMDPKVRILTHSHMTAVFSTRSGNVYTAVTRPSVGVVLINEDRGTSLHGSRIRVLNNTVYLIDDEGQIMWQTTPVVSISILSN